MTIDVILTAKEVEMERVQHKCVVVIDVFRATSVIVTALKARAKQIIPVTNVNDAFIMKEALEARGIHPLLGGERNGVRVEGFDKGNSPKSYADEDIQGQTIIFSTTNGTKAINNSRSSSIIYIGAFLNLSAVCEKMVNSNKDIVIVCSGRSDRFTMEDFLCAGAMVEKITETTEHYTLTDIAKVSLTQYNLSKDDLNGALKDTTHYKFMEGINLQDDIKDCLKIDTINTVPYLNELYSIIL